MQNTRLPERPSDFELSEVLSSLDAVGQTDTTIAKALNVSRVAVNHWRHNRNNVSREHWLALCQYATTLAHSDLAEAVSAQSTPPKFHECKEHRLEAATRGIVDKLLGPGVVTDAIVDLAIAEGTDSASTFRIAASRSVDQLTYENVILEECCPSKQTDSLKWDEMFAGEEEPEAHPFTKSMAQQVHDIVNTRDEEKERMYGPFSEGMARAAQIFCGATGIQVEAKHMYMALVALKLSRQSYNHKDDNLMDAMAYLQGLANLENGQA